MIQLEQEIQQLTQRRAILFEEWASLVKKNERDFEDVGTMSFETLKKADELLKEQRIISKSILTLLDKMDDLKRAKK